MAPHLEVDGGSAPDPVASPVVAPAATPPETGGQVRLFDRPLDPAAAEGTLRDLSGKTGAVVAFTGFVRGDAWGDALVDETIVALDFEAYPEMAIAELERVRSEAVDRFPVLGVTIHHRVGQVPLGDPIVQVAVAARHRREAFAAAEWTMDAVKRRVPLWKQEVAAGGRRRWVSGDACGAREA